MRLPHIGFLILATILFATATSATCAVHEWTIQLDAVRMIEAKSDPTGNVYALLNAPSHEAVELKKLDPSGRELWTSPALSGNSLTAFDFDATGNVYLALASWVPTRDIVTEKHDPSGRVVWQARFTADAGWHSDDAPLVVDRQTGSVFVVARLETDSEADGVKEGALAIIKYGPNGEQEWLSQYRPGAVSVSPTEHDAVVATGDGGVAVLAGSNLPDASALLRYSAQGNLLWTHTERLGMMDRVSASAEGALYTASYGDVRRYAPTGALQWVAPFGVVDFAVDAMGNAYVTGGRPGWPVTTRKYGPNGEQLWSADYFPADGSLVRPGALTIDGSGSVYLDAYHVEEMPGMPPGWAYRTKAVATLKYDGRGAPQWLAIHGPAPEGTPIDHIAVDDAGRVFVISAGTVIKYAQVEVR